MTNDYEIRAPGLGDLCLSVGYFNGSQAYLGNCTGGPNQKWILMPDGSVRPMFDGSFCLDVAYGGTAAGTPLAITTCNPKLAYQRDRTAGWSAQTFRFSYGRDRMFGGERLKAYQGLRSPNGKYWFFLDGCNLEFWINHADGYGPGRSWQSNTAGSGTDCRAEMQTDRNLVVYDDRNRVVWASDTYHAGVDDPIVRVQVQDDANVAIYANATYCLDSGWWALWSPSTGSTKPWQHCTYIPCESRCELYGSGFACGIC